ncbi:hypothetical protein G6514_002276 [Epicoccum nigrum]|nr:hypothetical protein G6514_002276 [Epicoccum nigrum]
MLGPEGHVYDSLPTPTSIRVIFLAPGKPDEDVSCFLFPCDLDKDRTIDPSVPRPFESMCVAVALGLNPKDDQRTFMLPVDSYVDDGTAPGVESKGQKRRSRLSRFFKPERANEKVIRAAQATTKTAATYQSEGEPSDDVWDLIQLSRLVEANGKLDSQVRAHPFQRFAALSYVWGSIEDPACITIDQTKFWITRNLFNALKALRRPDKAISLWIDAICINQNDLQEKKVQIGLMRRIYRQAQKVTAYVPQTSEDAENLGLLMQEILRIDAKCTKVIEAGVIPEQVVSQDDEDNIEADPDSERPAVRFVTRPVPLVPTGTCLEDHGLPSEDDAIWGAWRRFFASPYFRRIWILQEYALGFDLHFCLSERYQFKGDIMLVVMNAVESKSRLLNAHYLGRGENGQLTRGALLGWRGLYQMMQERVFTQRDIYGSKQLPNCLIDKLDKALSFDSTDPRDKIYALLGLVSDADQFMDLVSYQPEDTYSLMYQRFAKKLIEKGHLTEILRLSCTMPNSAQIPSWVPDLSVCTADTLVKSINLDKRFQAGGTMENTKSSLHLISDNQLTLNGRTLATILYKTSAFVPYNSSIGLSTGVGRIQDLFETMLEVYSQLDKALGKELPNIMMDIFHVATMQDKNVNSDDPDNPTPTEMFDDLRLWMNVQLRMMSYREIEGHANHKVTFSAMPEGDRDFLQRIMGNVAGRCFCVVEVEGEQRLGLVLERVLVGDTVAIINGVATPLVLRKTNPSEHGNISAYRLISDAYIMGAMMGEHAQGSKGSSEIVLV